MESSSMMHALMTRGDTGLFKEHGGKLHVATSGNL